MLSSALGRPLAVATDATSAQVTTDATLSCPSAKTFNYNISKTEPPILKQKIGF